MHEKRGRAEPTAMKWAVRLRPTVSDNDAVVRAGSVMAEQLTSDALNSEFSILNASGSSSTLFFT